MMKKSLSLLLALVLVLGMTAFAQQTQIYLVKDFSEYSTGAEAIASFVPSGDVKAGSSGAIDTGAALAAVRASGQDGPDAVSQILNLGNSISTANTEFGLNTNGKAALSTKGGSATYSGLLLIPSKSWDFTQNQDEIYVLSFDLDVNPFATKDASTYNADPVFFADAQKQSAAALRRTYFVGGANNKVTYHVNSSTTHGSGSWGATLTPDKTYRMAFGWAFDETAVFTDASGNPYNVPRRYFYRNAGKWSGNSYTSINNWGTTHEFSGKSILTALGFSWEQTYGFEFADFLVYTVKKDTSAFAVSMVDDAIELGDSAIVKFNMPIYGPSVTKESLTMTENGAPFTMFDIGNVDFVVDETTGEVYSTVEIIFPFGQKENTTYGIEFNTTGSTVKTELSWTLPAGNNAVSFTTGSAPNNLVTLSATNGLAGDGDAVTGITATQAKFKAVAEASEKPAYLFVGIYDSYDNLISYTYTLASTGDELSLASKVEAGYKVKAFSCGSVYDLTQVFGTGDDIQ